MLKKNLLFRRLSKNILRNLQRLLVLFTKNSKGRYMWSNLLIYQNLGKCIEELTSARPILRLASGRLWMVMKTGTYSPSTIKQARQSITMLELSTQIQHLKGWLEHMETLLEPNGYKSSHKEESTSHPPTKKSVQTSTHGLDLELKKSARNLSVCSEGQHLMSGFPVGPWVCLRCGYSPTASILSENSKPIVGKKKQLLKHKI